MGQSPYEFLRVSFPGPLLQHAQKRWVSHGLPVESVGFMPGDGGCNRTFRPVHPPYHANQISLSQLREILKVSRKQSGQAYVCPECGATTRVPSLPTPESETPPSSSGGGDRANRRSAAGCRRGFEAFAGISAGEPQTSPQSGQGPHGGHSQIVMSAEVGPFRVKHRLKSDDGMDLTPMVDVTFLLLIFFMITASFSLQKTLEFPSRIAGEGSSPDVDDGESAKRFDRNQDRRTQFDFRRRDSSFGTGAARRAVDSTPIQHAADIGCDRTPIRMHITRPWLPSWTHPNAAGMESIKLISRKPGKK